MQAASGGRARPVGEAGLRRARRTTVRTVGWSSRGAAQEPESRASRRLTMPVAGARSIPNVRSRSRLLLGGRVMRPSLSGAQLRGKTGPGPSPGTPGAPGTAMYPSQQQVRPAGAFVAQGVVPAERGPSPKSALGVVTYSGQGPALWLSSCHGGAGASTLAALLPACGSAGRYWPVPVPQGRSRVLLVARGHASGLLAAQAAMRQWAARGLPSVQLLGLAVVADAPGKRPKPLADLLQLITGGVPRVWDLPWVEGFRLGEPPNAVKLPAAYSRLIRDMAGAISAGPDN
ncbi:DUF6668 family protein [Actinomadura verrucosospora]|uniref:DUF6668 family protein n=1 Tax=Actinomadura verrucosospora TaxID=46165 RepID=UPI0031B5DE82